MFLLATMDPSTPRLQTELYLLLLGTGTGFIYPIIVPALQNAVPQKDLGAATSANFFFRNLGSSFGVAVYGAIMNARLRFWIPRLAPGAKHLNLSASRIAISPAQVRHLPPAVRSGIVLSFSHSLHDVFLFAAPIGSLLVPLFLFMREVPLRTEAHVTEAAPEPTPTALEPATTAP